MSETFPSLITLNKIQQKKSIIRENKLLKIKDTGCISVQPLFNEDVAMFRINQITFMSKDK